MLIKQSNSSHRKAIIITYKRKQTFMFESKIMHIRTDLKLKNVKYIFVGTTPRLTSL